MKHQLVALVACSLPFLACGQVALQNSVQNILYNGTTSPLMVVAESPIDTVRMEHVSIASWNRLSDRAIEFEVTASPDPKHKEAVIACLGPDGGVLAEHHFRIKLPPAPVVRFAWAEHGDSLKSSLIQGVPGLSASCDHFDYAVRMVVTEFEVTTRDARTNESRRFHENGWRFSDELSDHLGALPSGSSVSFDRIQCMVGEGLVYPQTQRLTVYVK